MEWTSALQIRQLGVPYVPGRIQLLPVSHHPTPLNFNSALPTFTQKQCFNVEKPLRVDAGATASLQHRRLFTIFSPECDITGDGIGW